MTWYYNIADDRNSMDIYDHNGNLHTTVTNDGSGLTIPADIYDVMAAEASSDANEGNTQRAVIILTDMRTGGIEAGTPP